MGQTNLETGFDFIRISVNKTQGDGYLTNFGGPTGRVVFQAPTMPSDGEGLGQEGLCGVEILGVGVAVDAEEVRPEGPGDDCRCGDRRLVASGGTDGRHKSVGHGEPSYHCIYWTATEDGEWQMRSRGELERLVYIR